MPKIDVIKGVKYTPEMFLKRMNKSKRMRGITCTHANTVYSLCWIFQFRIALAATKKTTRYAGYYAGFDEVVMTPGKLAMLPTVEKREIDKSCILADKLTEDEALAKAWEYNQPGIIRKFRQLNAPPILEDYVAEKYYKPLYVFEFYNQDVDEKKYKVLDSLTGDLMDIHIT